MFHAMNAKFLALSAQEKNKKHIIIFIETNKMKLERLSSGKELIGKWQGSFV
jgi:hypothetical protein